MEQRIKSVSTTPLIDSKIALELDALRIAALQHPGKIVGVRMINQGLYAVDQYDSSGKVIRENITQVASAKPVSLSLI